VCRRLSFKWCRSTSIEKIVQKIVIATPKNVWQPKTNATTLAIDEKDGWLKHGIFDVSAMVDFIQWGPSALPYDGAFSLPGVEV
jgi:hypothetical protein